MQDHQGPAQKSSTTMVVIVLVVLVAVAAAFFFLRDKESGEASTQATPVAVTPQEEAPEELPQESIPETVYQPPQPIEEPKPLPALNDSDSSVLDALRW